MALTGTLAAKMDVGSTGNQFLLSTLSFAVGDIVDVEIGWTSSGDEAPATMGDNLASGGNSYAEKSACRVRNAANGQSMTVLAAKVTQAGTPTISWTWPGGGSRSNVHVTITKVAGSPDVTGTPPAQGNKGDQASPGTGTDAVATQTVTPSATGALVIGTMQDVNNGSVTITKKSSATALSNTGGADGVASEYEVLSGTSAYAATFTISANRVVISATRAYEASGGGGGGGPNAGVKKKYRREQLLMPEAA